MASLPVPLSSLCKGKNIFGFHRRGIGGADMRIWQRLLHILIPAMLSFQAHNQITGSRQGAGDLFLTCALLDVSDVLWEASDTGRIQKQKCSRNELSLKIDISADICYT